MATLENDGKTFSYRSMGTAWAVTIWNELSPERLLKIEGAVVAMSQEFDRTYSRFIPTSFITELSRKTGVVEVPKDLVEMLQAYRMLYIPSNKKLNPLIGFTISDLGYDESYSLKEKPIVRATPDLLETVRIVDKTHIDITEPVLIDLGALGKGYFVDRIADSLRENGISEFLVDGSGDIAYRREQGVIHAGLEDPDDNAKVIGTIELSGEGALCASSGSRRRWGKYHHTIDPESHASPEGVGATWVMAKNAALADALATCLFFVPPEQFQPAHTFDWCIMKSGREVSFSSGFRARFFVPD